VKNLSWSGLDVERMLGSLGTGASARKLQLFMVVCARSVLPRDPDPEMVVALDAAERSQTG
jgi:hypothetical protein